MMRFAVFVHSIAKHLFWAQERGPDGHSANGRDRVVNVSLSLLAFDISANGAALSISLDPIV